MKITIICNTANKDEKPFYNLKTNTTMDEDEVVEMISRKVRSRLATLEDGDDKPVIELYIDDKESVLMIEQTAPTAPTTSSEKIITCSVPGPRNNFGKRKLLAKITPDGIKVWCKTCEKAHLLSRAEVIAAWEKGESVQCVEEER